MDRNHHFTGHQQERYDSLSAEGRSYYDELRWNRGFDNDAAFDCAFVVHGQSKYYLRYTVPEQGYNVLDKYPLGS